MCVPYRNRLVNFYTKHNPAKLDEVEDLLKKYEGNEELLFTRLHRKYNALASGVDAATGKKIVSKDFDESDFLYEEEEEVVAYEEERAQEADNEESSSANERSAAGGSSGDGESENEEGFQVVKAPLSPSFAKRLSPLSPLSSASAFVPEPPGTPNGVAVTSDKSSRIQAAIQEAKRAQDERTQQRIAQLKAHGKH